ncbi:MAG: hypothetical protein NDI75_15300 [Candidatus Didemnitutus sp.]|nr:hypothetical protein [Candidatus Didemnitutus sp.]
MNILLASVASAAPTPAVKFIISAVPALLMLSAIPAGIIALCGVSKHGKKKLLWKGLVGVFVPIVFIAMAIPAFLAVKRRSEERARQQQQ